MATGLEQPGVAECSFREVLASYGLITRFMARHFTAAGITGAKWGVLRTLHRAHLEGVPALRPCDLVERLLIRPPGVTALVGRLSRQGLVAVRRAESDHRERLIALTPAGHALVERALDAHAQRVHAAMSGLSAADQARLGGLLSRLNTHLRGMIDAPEPGRPRRAPPRSQAE